MIFRNEFLRMIQSGRVKVAFRQWKRLSICEGKTLRTKIGVIRFKKVQEIEVSRISNKDAKLAGYTSLNDLMDDLSGVGSVYKISFELIGPDPRVELRSKTKFSAVEADQIIRQLRKMDTRGRVKWWIVPVLEQINSKQKNSSQISNELGLEQANLKLKIRKLKDLGLTMSFNAGYGISPRGRKVLRLYKTFLSKFEL